MKKASNAGAVEITRCLPHRQRVRLKVTGQSVELEYSQIASAGPRAPHPRRGRPELGPDRRAIPEWRLPRLEAACVHACTPGGVDGRTTPSATDTAGNGATRDAAAGVDVTASNFSRSEPRGHRLALEVAACQQELEHGGYMSTAVQRGPQTLSYVYLSQGRLCFDVDSKR